MKSQSRHRWEARLAKPDCTYHFYMRLSAPAASQSFLFSFELNRKFSSRRVQHFITHRLWKNGPPSYSFLKTVASTFPYSRLGSFINDALPLYCILFQYACKMRYLPLSGNSGHIFFLSGTLGNALHWPTLSKSKFPLVHWHSVVKVCWRSEGLLTSSWHYSSPSRSTGHLQLNLYSEHVAKQTAVWCCAWKRATIGSVYQCRYWRTLDHQMASYRVQRNHNGRRDWSINYLSKACFCFSPQAIQSPAAVSVFSVVDLFIGLVGFCEAMKAAQFDTSSGNVSIWCEKSRAESYFSCLFKFFSPLRRLGLNWSVGLPKLKEWKKTISKSSAHPSNVALG